MGVMNAIVTSIIAVLGTVLGSTVTHVFQLRTARRAEENTRQERLRRERLDVYGAYAGLLVDFRQAMLHHWYCVHEGRDAEDEVALRGRSFELRSNVQTTLFQLQLITDVPALVTAAVDAFRAIGDINRVESVEDIATVRYATWNLIDTFVARARQNVDAPRCPPSDRLIRNR